MSRFATHAAPRAGLLGLALTIAAACVSVNPPTPSPQPPQTQTASPSATAPPTSSPTASAAPESPGTTASPDSSAPPATPGASMDPALREQIDAVNAQIPPIRQLDALEDVAYELISREQFRDNLVELAFEDIPEEWRRAEERFLKRMGLLPDDADLEQLILDLYGAAVAAYYDPDTGRFYIIERDAPFGPTDKVTTAHEYTHALQDQHFDLEGNRITDLPEGDAILAQIAVIEGDATLTSQQWFTANLTPDEQFQLLQEALEQLDDDLLAGMPTILRRQLEFPYSDGFVFVDEIYRLGGFEAVNQAIETPPASTEQILHPQKYFDQEQPLTVTTDDLSADLGEGWSLVYEQTMGELNTQIFVAGGETPPINIPGLPVEWPHAEAAAGWGGDRLDMYEGPDGEEWLIDWQTTWDTQADAAEFASRANELIGTIDGETRVLSEGSEVRLIVASDPELFQALPSG